MPEFSVMPVGEALKKAETSGISQTIAEYVEYISQLPEGQAGRLRPSDGEDFRTVRMRLGAAARKINKKVIIRRAGNEVLFWVAAA